MELIDKIEYNKKIIVSFYKYKPSNENMNVFSKNSHIMLNGIQINKNSNSIMLLNKTLALSHYIINVNSSYHHRKSLPITKIINKTMTILLQKPKKKMENNNIPVLSIKEKKGTCITKFYYILIIIVIAIFTLFLMDYQAIKTRIEEPRLKELAKLKSQYQIEDCDSIGNFPAFKESCDRFRENIKIKEKESISNISVFIVWLFDAFEGIYNVFGLRFILLSLFIILNFLIIIKR